MEVNEMRVGNYVSHDDYTAGIFVVESINYNYKHKGYEVNTLGGKNGSWINSNINVIPVRYNDEMLVSNGFEVVVSPGKCGYRKGVITIYCEETYVGDVEVYHAEFVHELQNLYFAIYGEELEWKF